MQITLDHNEIEQAINEFIVNRGILVVDGKAKNITMVAGRGSNGFSATVDLTLAGATEGVEDTEDKSTDPPKIEFTEEDTPEMEQKDTENLFGN